MTTEKLIQTGLRTAFRELSIFAFDDVVINDWDLLDGPLERGPYLIIMNYDNFDWRQDVGTVQQTNMRQPVSIVQPFLGTWKETLDAFRDVRQTVKDKLVGVVRSAGGIEGLTIGLIRNGSPIEPRYLIQVSEDGREQMIPAYVEQEIILESVEF